MLHTTIVRIACPVALTLSMFAMSGGEAGASPSVTGQVFGDASSTLSNAGFKPIVSATFGDQLRKDKCLVVNQRDESVAQKGSHSTSGKTVALSLNCENSRASATKAGFSAASPEGRAAKAAADAAAAKPTS
ncbi:hypothetical protein [Mycolicibacterium hodleri]